MDPREQDIEQEEITSEVDDSEEETTDVEPEVTIDGMLDKIIDGENVSAQQDFESIIAAKLNDALEAKKQELAVSLYNSPNQDQEEQEEQENETEPQEA